MAAQKVVALLTMESATSFIGRIAASQRAVTTSDYCLDRLLDYEDLRLGRSDAIAKVARWGNVDPGTLQHQACTRISSAAVRLLGHEMPEGMLDLTHTRICPACLRDDLADPTDNLTMYGRLPWMLRCVRTCPQHGVAIVRLPLPAEHRTLQDFVGHVRPVKQRVLQGVLDVAVAASPDLERYLFARLSGESIDVWLDGFPPHVVARFSEVLGAALHFGRAQKSQEMSD